VGFFDIIPRDQFIQWYNSLYNLSIFWTKKTLDFKVQRNCFLMKVLYRRRRKKFTICVESSIEEIISMDCVSDLIRLILPEDETLSPKCYSNKALLYFWTRTSRILSPNKEIKVKIYEKVDGNTLEAVSKVQKKSWGFFIEPKPHLHVVFIGYGYLDGEPVASAYYNPLSSNIDFGIHVARDL